MWSGKKQTIIGAIFALLCFGGTSALAEGDMTRAQCESDCAGSEFACTQLNGGTACTSTFIAIDTQCQASNDAYMRRQNNSASVTSCVYYSNRTNYCKRVVCTGYPVTVAPTQPQTKQGSTPQQLQQRQQILAEQDAARQKLLEKRKQDQIEKQKLDQVRATEAARNAMADPGYCNSQYAPTIFRLWEQGKAKGCKEFKGNNVDGHYQWCLKQTQAKAEAAIEGNVKRVAACVP